MFIATKLLKDGMMVLDTADNVTEFITNEMYQQYKSKGIEIVGNNSNKLYRPDTKEIPSVLIGDDGVITIVGYSELQIYVNDKKWDSLSIEPGYTNCEVMVNPPKTNAMIFISYPNGTKFYNGNRGNIKLQVNSNPDNTANKVVPEVKKPTPSKPRPKNLNDLRRRLEENQQRYNKYLEEHSIHSFKSEYVGCKNCGSKLKISLIKGEICPLCRTDLRSPTTIETLKKYIDKSKELTKEIKLAEKKQSSKSTKTTTKKPEGKTISPQQQQYNNLLDELDYVLEEHKTPDFIEVIGKIGGDVVTHRIYNSGMIVER